MGRRLTLSWYHTEQAHNRARYSVSQAGERPPKAPTERLKPFMKEASLKVGETIFNKGDYADRLYMIIAGDIHLEQIDHILRAGDLFGN